jgi:hypothetical protein
MGFWIGGLVTEIVTFPLISVPSVKYLILDLMVALTVVWFSACGALVLFQFRIEKHIQQTLQSRDVTGLSCWLDTLFGVASTKGNPHTAGRCCEEARAAILEQLPHLTEESASLLRSRERLTLFKTLRGEDAEMISVVLLAVAVFADARALPFVRHLSEGKGLAAKNEDLRAEAQASLNRLQAILDLSSGSQALLRASSPPQAPEEQLLHPIQGNSETDPKELLRADVQK